MEPLLLADPKADSGLAAATAYIDTAIRAGNPIGSVRDQLIEQFVDDPAGTISMIERMAAVCEPGTKKAER